MKRFLWATAILMTLGGPLWAEATVEDEVTAAYDAFVLPGAADMTPSAQRQAVAESLIALEGRWVVTRMLREMDGRLPDAETLERACAALGQDLVATAPYQFDMSHTDRRGNSTTYQYRYVFGNTFLATVDDAELARQLGLEDVSPEILADTLLSANQSGYVSLFVPSENVMVLQPMARHTEILARCQAAP